MSKLTKLLPVLAVAVALSPLGAIAFSPHGQAAGYHSSSVAAQMAANSKGRPAEFQVADNSKGRPGEVSGTGSETPFG